MRKEAASEYSQTGAAGGGGGGGRGCARSMACGGLITGEGDIELAVLWQAEGSPDGLCELPITVWTWLHLKAVRPAIKVDVHDCRGVGPTPGSQG